MKITLFSKAIDRAPKTYIRVQFDEKEPTHLSEKNGVKTLVFHVGKEPMGVHKARRMTKNLIRTAKGLKLERLAVSIDDICFPGLLPSVSREWVVGAFTEDAHIAHYDFDKYKSKKNTKQVKEVLLTNAGKADAAIVRRAEMIAKYVNACRDVANTPGGDMTPQGLAECAEEIAKGTNVHVRILDRYEIEREKMGALLGVAKGSDEDPRFIIMEYWGAQSREDAPVVFVGKGVTFDSGGLSIKPADAMLDMHLDMSGGASVIAAVTLAAKLGIKKNVIGLIPAAENMVSGTSFRPGDVLTSMSGKTIDVLNTDAEGRLLLADGLTYAERYKPKLVVDIATLTGAAVVALGYHASAVMSRDASIVSKISELAETSGDYVWPLPLWEEFSQYMKGVHGDIANIPAAHGRAGGTITAGIFLSHFTGKYPWAHIDMAPRMVAAPGDHMAKGSTGEPVRLLLAIAEHF